VNFRNWIINEESVGIVDLDSVSVGPAATDLGSLLSVLHYRHRIGRLSRVRERRSVGAFLAGYASVRALPAARALRWHTAAALLNERAFHAVTLMRPEALPNLDVLLADARAILTGDGDV
jgi:Ser/Thr protein kinase RdoA (MazF antagonist)